MGNLPPGISNQPRRGGHADLHEYAPRQKEDRLAWRLLVAPYLRWICRYYVARADSVTTDGHGLDIEYERVLGVTADVGPTASRIQELSPHRVQLSIWYLQC